MRMRLQARTSAVRDVRHRVARWAEANGAPRDVLRTVALLTSELVTNAVEHGPSNGPITVAARRGPEGFRVAVSDSSSKDPVLRAREVGQVRGRGMQLVELLSQEWGVERHPGNGKSVWFVVTA